ALGSIGVAWLAGTLTFGQIAVVGFVEGSMFVIASVAEPAAVAHVVPAQQLPTALAQNEARVRGAMLLGQPLGGLLFGIGEASPTQIGLIVAGTGVGGVAGSLIAPSVQRRVHPRWVVIGCNWIWALLFPLFAVAPGPLALGAVWAAAAFVGPVWNVVLGTYAI